MRTVSFQHEVPAMTPWPEHWPTPLVLRRLAYEIVSEDEGGDYVFGQAVLSALNFPPEDSENLLGWFRATMTRARIDWLRSSGSQPQIEVHSVGVGSTFDTPIPDEVASELERAELGELVEFLSDEVDALAPRDREIVRLDFWEGLTTVEIAARLNVSKSTVQRTRRRVLDSMRSGVLAAPQGKGRALLALAGAPAQFWKREPVAAAVAGASAGSIALLVAAVVMMLSIGLFHRMTRASDATSADAAVARLNDISLEASAESVADQTLVIGAGSAARTVGDAPFAVAEGSLTTNSPPQPATAPVVIDEPVEVSTQVIVLTVNDRGEPLTGMVAEGWTLDARGLPVLATDKVAKVEEIEPGVYRFEMPTLAKPWHMNLVDRRRRVALYLERPLNDVPQSESFDLEIAGRSFALPAEAGKNFDHPRKSPWGSIKGITELRPATWLWSSPRRHGGHHLNGWYERAFDGTLHFDGAAASGMTLCYHVSGADPSGWEAVSGISEAPFVSREDAPETPDLVQAEALPVDRGVSIKEVAAVRRESVKDGR